MNATIHKLFHTGFSHPFPYFPVPRHFVLLSIPVLGHLSENSKSSRDVVKSTFGDSTYLKTHWKKIGWLINSSISYGGSGSGSKVR